MGRSRLLLKPQIYAERESYLAGIIGPVKDDDDKQRGRFGKIYGFL